MDWELEKRGHKFVRYANDMVILCKSRHSAERTMKSIVSYIERKLFLKVNRDKSQVTIVRSIKFLGYSFYRYKGEGRLRIHYWHIAKSFILSRTITDERLRKAGYVFRFSYPIRHTICIGYLLAEFGLLNRQTA